MPQLDTTTYLAQITWLAITYSTFYLVLTKYTLPSITKILYTRQYKAQQAQQAIQSPLHHETVHTQQHSLQHVQDACAQAKTILQNTMNDSQKWHQRAAQRIQHTHLVEWHPLKLDGIHGTKNKKGKKTIKNRDSFYLETDYKGMLYSLEIEGAYIDISLKYTMNPAAQMACKMNKPHNTKKTQIFQKYTLRGLLSLPGRIKSTKKLSPPSQKKAKKLSLPAGKKATKKQSPSIPKKKKGKKISPSEE
jgi:hypothetical protein